MQRVDAKVPPRRPGSRDPERTMAAILAAATAHAARPAAAPVFFGRRTPPAANVRPAKRAVVTGHSTRSLSGSGRHFCREIAFFLLDTFTDFITGKADNR